MQEPWAASTIPQLVRAAAERFADQSAIEDGETKFSFSDLLDESLQATRAFCAAGIVPGDRVAIWAPNIWEWIVAALGLQSAGGILVTANTRLKGAEAAYVLRKSGVRILCTMGDFLGTNYVDLLREQDLPELEQIVTFRSETDGATSWTEFMNGGNSVTLEEARDRADAVSPEDLCDFIPTSGTTGNPKAVMTAHGQNLRAFESWSEVVGLREGDRYLISSPFFHSMGYKAGWLACLMRGATSIPHAVFNVEEILRRVGRERISVLVGAPTIYQDFLAHPNLKKHDISNLRLAVTGAAPTPVELIRRMRTELGFETTITGYGLTEVCGIATMCRYDDDPEVIATTSGRAIPNVEVRCVDTDNKEVARGDAGEVVVRGYNVMAGYFDDEAETARTIDSDGWLHTGDIAIMDENDYVRITDRIKDMFITGGLNCYPAEIENLLFGSGDFAQVAVIGVPDDRMGEVCMAFVVPAPGRAVTADSVIAWSRANMANYKVPRYVEVVDSLPTTASGKVTKFVLRKQASQLVRDRSA